jgi:ribosomal-protein-alanine N-acetyltransferase
MNNKIKQAKNTFNEIKVVDVKALMPIELACHAHPWTEKTFTSCIGGRYFAEVLAEPKVNAGQQKSDILGFYVGEYVIGEATLMNICVTPTEQGKGYGKLLLTQFLNQAKKKGATKIFLEVRAKNIAAQMLYMNNGFVEIDRRIGYYPSNTGFGYEDAIVMALNC